MSSKETDERHLMHSKSDHIKMINDKVDDLIKELFQSFLSRYQIGWEARMKDINFIFDYVHLLYCKCNKMNLNHDGPDIDSLDCIKANKQTINAINLINKNDNKCFQYAATRTLNHEEIWKNSERIAKIKPLIDKYHWERINFLSGKG